MLGQNPLRRYLRTPLNCFYRITCYIIPMDKDIISKLHTYSVSELMNELVALNAQSGDDTDYIQSALILQTGAALNGSLIKFDSKKNIILLLTKSTYTYVSADAIVGITLEHSDKASELVTANTVVIVPSGREPTEMELRREIEKYTDLIAEHFAIKLIVDESLTSSKNTAIKYQLFNFMKIIFEALQTTTENAVGEKALNDINDIYLDSSSGTMEVTNNKAEKTLSILVDFEQKIPSTCTEDIRNLLEKAL